MPVRSRARSGCTPGRGARRRSTRRTGSASAVGAPDLARVVVPQVDGLAGRVADGIVGPRRQLVLAAVVRPGVARRPTPRPGSRTTGWRRRSSTAPASTGPGPSTVTYSRPSSAKPPRPLKNSRSRRGAAASASGRDGVGPAARATAARRGSARSRRMTWSARLPRRLSSTARAAVCEQRAILGGQLVAAQDEDAAARLVGVVAEDRLARADQRPRAHSAGPAAYVAPAR